MVLSVVIVNWNTQEQLAACLRSLARCGLDVRRRAQPDEAGDVEVVVVDNASSDGSAAMVRETFPWVRLIENAENVGYARANNQGIRSTAGRYVLLLNPDTEVHPGALEALLDVLERSPGVGATGARLLNADGSLQPSCAPEPSLSREAWRLFHLDRVYPYGDYDSTRWNHSTPRDVGIVSGACIALRREALDEVGLLDEDYFIYSEEFDLCRRLRRAGWAILWVPQATVLHHGGQSTRQNAAEMFLRLHQGKVLYFRKARGAWTARAYKGILLSATLARLACAPLMLLETTELRTQHARIARNYLQLLTALPQL